MKMILNTIFWHLEHHNKMVWLKKNRTLQEMATTMLNDLPKYLQPEAVNTPYHVLNKVLIRPTLNKTPYEIWKGTNPTLVTLRFLDASALF